MNSLIKEEKKHRSASAGRSPIHLGALVLIAAILTSFFGLSTGEAAVSAASAAADIGYRDMEYKTSGVSEPTAQKPQSKLWFNDGQWWGDFYSKDSGAYHIYALDWGTQVWSDTGVALDEREKSWADVLWDGTYLYVASGTEDGPGLLYRYTYEGSTYNLNQGFPVEITQDSMEALVFAKDSTGTLWITYTKGGKVYVAHSNGSDSSWVTPYVLPITEATGLFNDDISAIVAYDGHIGVMWSNQTLNKMVFAAHVDGAADDQWQSASTYTLSADDHINLKSLRSDSAGNVFAVVKTSFSTEGDPAIVLLACTSGDCTSAVNWQAHTVYERPAASQRTRPILLIDTENRDVYVFMANSGGGPIRYKKSSIDALDFSGVSETIFIEYGGGISDPTSTKQNLDSISGLVVAASDSTYYYHNYLEIVSTTPRLKLSATAYSVGEGDGKAIIEVQRTGALSESITVNYTISDDTAVADSDYAAVPGTVTIGAGETSNTFSIDIVDDDLHELPETFTVTLENPGNAFELSTPSSSVVTITDNDDPPTVQFETNRYSGSEWDTAVTIAVTLSAPSSLPVNVDYATEDGTGKAGRDYVAVSGVLTFTPGQTRESFNVTILKDDLDEPDETVHLLLANANNAVLVVPKESELVIKDSNTAVTFVPLISSAP